MRHVKEDVVADNEFSEVTVVGIVLVTAEGSVNTGFGLDERITARNLAASHSRCTPLQQLIIRVALTRRWVAEGMRSNGWLVLLVG